MPLSPEALEPTFLGDLSSSISMAMTSYAMRAGEPVTVTISLDGQQPMVLSIEHDGRIVPPSFLTPDAV